MLRSLAAKVAPSAQGTVKLKVSCTSVDKTRVAPADCAGTLRVTARVGKKSKSIGTKKFTLTGGKTGTVSLKLSAAARAVLKTGSLKASVKATVGTESATKTIVFRKIN